MQPDLTYRSNLRRIVDFGSAFRFSGYRVSTRIASRILEVVALQYCEGRHDPLADTQGDRTSTPFEHMYRHRSLWGTPRVSNSNIYLVIEGHEHTRICTYIRMYM